MPKLCALIRSTGDNADAQRLVEELRPIFGEHIFLIIDRYKDCDRPELVIDDHRIFVGRAFLDHRKLTYFDRIGWQCGDIAYYAAAEALPTYDYFFMLEDDVALKYDGDFFSEFLKLDFDVALLEYGVAWSGWSWISAMAPLGEGPIYKAFFPASCLSRAAVAHLLTERQRYFENFSKLPPAEAKIAYANDEVFVATIAARSGLRVRNMAELFPPNSFKSVSWDYALHRDELPFLRQSIVHPVCDAEKARMGYARALHNFPASKFELARRLDEFSTRLGRDKWRDFTGLDPEAIDANTESATRDLLALKAPIDARLTAALDHGFTAWVYEASILVFEVATPAGIVTIDLSFAPALDAYKIEIFARQPDAQPALKPLKADLLPGEKLTIATLPAALPLPARAESAAQHIIAAFAKIGAGQA